MRWASRLADNRALSPCCLGAYPCPFLGDQPNSWLCISFIRGSGMDDWAVRGDGETQEKASWRGQGVEMELAECTAHSARCFAYTAVAWCGEDCHSSGELGQVVPQNLRDPLTCELCP